MLEAAKLLAERFSALRDGRAGPVFFIEHGLSETELEKLMAAVRQAVWRHPLESNWWRACPLPLIVSATDVGYRYRGTGTDFWPKLETAFGIEVSLDSRQRIRDLFEACSSKYRGARPPATPWATVFRLIAWPITHALVPREFHRQLAATLANLRANASAFDNLSLHRAVRIAAGRSSTRFATFLENKDLALSVIRALLGGGDGEISEDAISRIAEDLTSDPDAQRDLALARRIQQRLFTQPVSPVETAALPTVAGFLQLRLYDDGKLAIEAQFPPVQNPDVGRLRRTLRRHRFAPRLWGVTSAVPSERFLSGLPFPVSLTAVPDMGAQLFEGLPELEIDSDLHKILESFKLDFRPPLLFAANADGDLARAVRGKEVSGYRVYWLLAANGAAGTFAGLPRLGEAGPFTCYKLDPSDVHAEEALKRGGYSVRFGVSVSIAGTPPLENYRTVPRFLIDDERIIVSTRANPIGSHVDLGNERVPLDGSLVRVRVPKGEHVLEISSPGASRQYRFEGVADASLELDRICWIELTAPEITVQALLGGNMALRIDGVAPLEGLALTLELEIAGRRVGTTYPLKPLPQVLFGDCEPWSTLLNKATREHVLKESDPILHARVGALASESWSLEQRLRPCWWVRGPLGLMLESELGPLAHGEIALDSPTARPAPAPFADTERTRLLSPLDPDKATYGSVAEFTTFCTAPDTLALSTPQLTKPRLRRSRREDADSIGVEQMAEAWLRWTLAESDSFTAEIRRRQVASQLDGWLAELVCGENWMQREDLVNPSFADPWILLVEACRETGRGLDPYVVVSTNDENEIIQLAVARIRRLSPELWVRIDSIAHSSDDTRDTLLDTDDYDALDAAFEWAYQQLAEKHRKTGKDEFADMVKEADPGSAPDQWDAVLERVKAGSEMRELGELLLPTDTAARLMALDVTLMPLGEIREELRRWALASRKALVRPVPADPVLEAMLALWIAPESAVVLDWRGALDTLLAERSLARAARYLALRARNVRR